MRDVAALVANADQVSAIAKAIAQAPLVAFDLEFLAQDRLVPTLCLVQVSWLAEGNVHDGLDARWKAIVASPPEVALLDALGVDLAPVVRALAAHPCAIAHAPRQDLALLAIRFGVALPAVIDTQTMAAFAGLGEQIGFASLANEILGVTLGKEQQWTDWAARPLSDAQLAYADADVRHLPAIYATLADRLGPRLAWARAESAQIWLDAHASVSVTPETAWKQLALRGLDATSAAAVVELAAWRYRVAVELDRPLGQVLNDKVLVELAKMRPADLVEVRAVRGISDLGRKRANELVAAIGRAKPEQAPPRALARGPSPRAQRWSEMLVAITAVVADQTGVAPRLLATRADAEEAARTVDEGGLDAARSLPAFSTWRREVLGDVWAGWLSGKIAVVGDAGARQGLQLVPR
jgi:ribonuclease D